MSIKLPDDLAELANLCRRIEAKARKMATALDRTTFTQRPESVQAAVEKNLFATYIYGPHDHGTNGCLFGIVDALAPEIARVIEEHDVRTAYSVVHPDTEGEGE
jgi:hypothetical protein